MIITQYIIITYDKIDKLKKYNMLIIVSSNLL